MQTPKRNSDVDFSDVFGGPPRRSSVNSSEEGEEEVPSSSCPWPPVFGEDNNNNNININNNSGGSRRRYQQQQQHQHSRNNSSSSSYFYDDIFGGEESPRKRDSKEFFTRTVLSPTPPLPLPLSVASSSLPAAFSLPTKLSKGADLPAFGSPTRTRSPLNDTFATSNVLAPTSDSHLSRNDTKPPYRQSLLSKEFSDMSIPDKAADKESSNMKQDKSSIPEVLASAGNGQFHFSIYKWASKGVPLVMPLRADRNSRKFKLERCSSAKEWIVNEITTENDDSPREFSASSSTKNRKQDWSTTSTTNRNAADSHQIVEQVASAKAELQPLSSIQTVFKDVGAESSTHSIIQTGFSSKTDTASEIQKLKSKPLHSLFNESDQKQDRDEMTKSKRGEENKTKSTKKKSSTIFNVAVNQKNQEENTTPLKGIGHSKANSQQGSSSLGENMGKSRAKGKVKEFVRIFNQEAVTKPNVDTKSRVQESDCKERGDLRTKNEVEGYPVQSKKESSTTEINNESANNLSQQDDISESAIPDISFTVIGDKDESCHENFTVQVLDQDENEVSQNQAKQEFQVIENKIRQWSKGKEGNIRSLLSTLQHVLWQGSGWKPVPLVDIIEGNGVKRAYQRALLCLHPDKLQQKGASSHQKYTAEKVFDILQEAWSQFNVVGAL
ncbi:hypothetical protein RIF29_12795 [Crotalaria pallida]|uniref:J domain-containing protein required for chloroplast accumulation response 1 n=1 Tax=Crotalaria pallida TaxID=3830 RepID=A0AAN9INP2_CROPI